MNMLAATGRRRSFNPPYLSTCVRLVYDIFMRASRLLSILTTLQAKGHVTAQALADECAVSLRTIYRDVDALSAAGIPVYSVQGSSGGYRLLDGYRVRLNGLSSTEADALFLAGLTRQAADLGMGAVAASARAKLVAALPEAMRSGAMKARFHFDAPAWFAEPETLHHLPAIADAVWNQHPIRMRYQSRTTDKERQVEPLGVVLKGGAWYLVAQIRDDVRSFRISRIGEMTVLDKRFDYPSAFNLEAHWIESIRRYEEDLHPNRAEVRLSPRWLGLNGGAYPALYPHRRCNFRPSRCAGLEAGFRVGRVHSSRCHGDAAFWKRSGGHWTARTQS